MTSGFAFAETVDIESIKRVNIRNLTVQENQVFTGGQPSPMQLRELSELGIRHVINLRPRQEQDWNEAEFVTALGMKYHSISVPGEKGITTSNAQKLSELLSSLNEEPVLLHCASGNRVGALIAVSSGDQGLNTEESIARGKDWGLTKLEPFVRKKLNAE